MHKSLLLLLFVLLLSAVYFIFRVYFAKDTAGLQKKLQSFDDLTDRQQVQIQVGQKVMTVEVVNTPQSTTLGLSGRDKIGADGMLFIFPAQQIRYFWMKDMQFDIDIVWIANNQVIEVTQAVPKPAENTPDYRLQTYSATSEVNMVLELPAFAAQTYGISSGDTVQLLQ